MKDELTNLMHLDFFNGTERTSLAVHCWFEQVSKGEDAAYWFNRLELTLEDITLYRGEWGNYWKGIDVEEVLSK
jgi:hypothetical protein